MLANKGCVGLPRRNRETLTPPRPIWKLWSGQHPYRNTHDNGVGRTVLAITGQRLEQASEMKTEFEYIRFLNESLPVRKTSIWSCHNVKTGFDLGTVRWWGAWRQYCFLPAANTVYSAGCLKDIQDFMQSLMAERKTR